MTEVGSADDCVLHATFQPSATRREALRATLSLPGLWLGSLAHAGAQLEEPLAYSVRTALSAAIANAAPPVPVHTNSQTRLAYLHWLAAMSQRLGERLRQRSPRRQALHDFLQTAWYESRRAGLDTALVLGLIQVESNFRRYAISKVGARGYMQVMPFWSRLIGDGDAGRLFHMQTNLRFGCVILRHYLERERGDIHMALGRYNGSRGQSAYPKAVLNAQRLWEFEST